MKKLLVITFAVLALCAVLAPEPLLAQACGDDTIIGDIKNIPCNDEAGSSQIEQILKSVFVVAGFLSVLFVVIGAIRYVLSSGNPESAKGAKDTILYALIGLIVAGSAFAIIEFVVERL
jgi:hypothetical protein